MEYKVLVRVYVPCLEQSYEIYVPVNKTISQVLVLLNRLINDISGGAYPIKNVINMYNRKTYEVYSYDTVVRDSDIRNGTELVLD